MEPLDLYGESKLAELLEDISKIEEIKWIRFLYSYPEGITEKLINVVATNPKIAKYFDIPIQHISDDILKKMNRKTSKKQIQNLIQNIRNKIPDVIIRTSLIVGFPEETQEDFEQLLDFVKTTKFEKLGTFMYSKEDGTPAAKMQNQIHGNTKKARYNKIMEAQRKISKEIMKQKIGKEYDVLIEEITFDKRYYVGRTIQDAPDIDGVVYVKNKTNKNLINNWIKCKIIKETDYDLVAEIIKEGK